MSDTATPNQPKGVTNAPRTAFEHADDDTTTHASTASDISSTGPSSPLSEASGVKKRRKRPSVSQRKAQKARNTASAASLLGGPEAGEPTAEMPLIKQEPGIDDQAPANSLHSASVESQHSSRFTEAEAPFLSIPQWQQELLASGHYVVDTAGGVELQAHHQRNSRQRRPPPPSSSRSHASSTRNQSAPRETSQTQNASRTGPEAALPPVEEEKGVVYHDDDDGTITIRGRSWKKMVIER